MGNAFVEATAATRVGDHRYSAELDEAWNLRPLPQGGIVTAAAVRAMAMELDNREQQPRSLHTTFVAQVTHGSLDIDVDVLRRGRSMSHARADVRNPDSPLGHTTTAVFGGPRDGFAFTDLCPPAEIPAPEDCRSFRDPLPEGVVFTMPPMPFWDVIVEGRPVLGHAPWDDYTPDRAERAAWNRFDDPPMLDDGSLDPLALIVLADMMPGAVAEKIGRQDRLWFAPSVDLTVHLLGPCRSQWVLAHNRARFAGDGYASADMALWDCGDDGRSTPRLVAYATQLFLFTFFDG